MYLSAAYDQSDFEETCSGKEHCMAWDAIPTCLILVFLGNELNN